MQHDLDNTCIQPYIPDEALLLNNLPEYLIEGREKAPKKQRKRSASKKQQLEISANAEGDDEDIEATNPASSFAASYFEDDDGNGDGDDGPQTPTPANNSANVDSSDDDTMSSDWEVGGLAVKKPNLKRKLGAMSTPPSPRHVTWRTPPVESELSPVTPPGSEGNSREDAGGASTSVAVPRSLPSSLRLNPHPHDDY